MSGVELRSLWAVGLVVSVAFAGCAGEEGDKQSLEGMGDAMEADGHNITAVIRVLVDGNASSEVNGSIPVVAGVNVTFDGTDSTGSNLTFAWDFGDDNESTEATAVHAYTQPGLYNVSLGIAQGNLTSNASLVLNVTASGPAPGTLVGTDTKSFTGSLTFGNPNACSSGINAALAGYDCRDHKVTIGAAAPDGTAGAAKVVRLTMTTSSASAVQMTVYWLGPAGATLKSASNAPPAAASPLSVTYEGDMAPGEYTVRVRMNAGANAAYTVGAEIDYVAT